MRCAGRLEKNGLPLDVASRACGLVGSNIEAIEHPVDNRAVGANDKQKLLVPHMRNRANLVATRIVDPDLSADIPLEIDLDEVDVAVATQLVVQVPWIMETLVAERNDHPGDT